MYIKKNNIYFLYFLFYKGLKKKKLSAFCKEKCQMSENTNQNLYCMVFVGIVLIILVFYFHVVYSELYLREYTR